MKANLSAFNSSPIATVISFESLLTMSSPRNFPINSSEEINLLTKFSSINFQGTQKANRY